MKSSPKRLIEVDLPIKRISAHARREKSIRHGHISTLHIWWARRPLAACRAVICAALWPDPAPGPDDAPCPPAFVEAARTQMIEWATKHAERASAASFARLKAIQDNPRILTEQPIELRNALLDFIADFANWDNSTVPEFLAASRTLTQAAHEALGGAPGTRPLVVDPFAGGGSIPFEALRVGADAFASDLNPVAVLLNKVVLEYIPKYGQRLADEVREWGEWIKREAEKELAEFYPKASDGATPIAYLWARTIQCEGPGCGAEVPLIRSLWLAKKANRSVALQLVPRPRAKRVDFRIIVRQRGGWVDQDDPKTKIADPHLEGTVKRGSATCPCCGYTTPIEQIRDQLRQKRGGADHAVMLAIRQDNIESGERSYRLPFQADIEAAHNAIGALRRLNVEQQASESLGLVPKERISLNEIRRISVPIYGMTEWGDLFSSRQALSLATVLVLIHRSDREFRATSPPEMRTAVLTCLAAALNRLADFNSSLCVLNATGGRGVVHTFGRQALPMVWDFVETNPLNEAGANWIAGIDALETTTRREADSIRVGHVEQASATQHPLPTDAADALVTDPPYYDAVPYAYLSDFFYVWFKRSIGWLFPALLSDELVPKGDEIVVDRPHSLSTSTKDIAFYENGLTRAFAEGRRILRADGVGTIVFASKTTASWEAVLKAIIDAGLVITASWPIDTEREARLAAQGQARLGSSIHVVCRPRENPDGSVRTDDVGDWRDVLTELPRRIHDWMPRLVEEGVVGADAIFACLGPALEIFSRYSRVEKPSGEAVTLKEYLEQVWAVVAKEALIVIFSGADATGFEEDARLTAMWLWTLKTSDTNGGEDGPAEDDSGDGEDGDGKKGGSGGFVLEFDAARKIAQGLGVHLEKAPSIVQVRGDTARLLPVVERVAHLFGKEAQPTASERRERKKFKQVDLFDDLRGGDSARQGERGAWLGEQGAPPAGATVLDRVHQAMILFGANRSEAMRRFLAEDGVGRDARFWRLAQALAALYPPGTDERRWVEGVLARKKGLGL